MQYVPHDYQRGGIQFGLENGRAAYFLDPGLGKTSIIYSIFDILQTKTLVNRMLVVAPLRVANSVWPREGRKWDEFSHLKIGILHGEKKKQILERWDDVQVINPEGLGWLFNEAQKWEWPWDMLVLDESTLFKNTRSQRFQTLKPMLRKFKRRYILTGSPAPNGLMDLFGQIYCLDEGASLGQYITKFQRTYFTDVGRQTTLQGNTVGFSNWVPRSNTMEQIYKKIDPLVMRLSADDCLKMDPYISNTIKVQLPKAARLSYNQMERLMVTSLPRDLELATITAKSAAAASMKCRQIANGGLYFGEGTHEAAHIHDAKLEAVQDLIEELNGKPAIIAYEFDHDLQRLRKAFPGAPYLGGGVSAKRQAEIEDAWNAGLLPVLLAQPQSVAHGLNLQGVGAAVIWHSLTWNLEYYEQLIRRVWRQGQSERIVVHHIVAEDTIDEVIKDTLGYKDRVQQTLLRNLQGYINRKRRPVVA